MTQSHLVRQIRERVATFGDRAAMRVQVDGGWQAISWRTLGRAMDGCAQALIRAGHQPGEMVGICARNMPEWTQADLGILAARGVSVPIYPTSTRDQVNYILGDAGIRLLFVGEQPQFDRALELLSAGAISRIVALDGDVDLRGCREASHFREFIAQPGDPQSEQELRRRESLYRADDLLTLIYTSGTTGEPKGVMLDFANIAACFEMHDRRIRLGEDDVSLCMLPLSHVFERVWTYYVLYRGAENVYIRDPQQVMDVIEEIRPTAMCAVPRLYEKAYAAIQARVAKAPPLRRALFAWATRVGTAAVAAPPGRRAAPAPARPPAVARGPARVPRAARALRRTHATPAGRRRQAGRRGQSLLPGHGVRHQVRLWPHRDHGDGLLLRGRAVQARLHRHRARRHRGEARRSQRTARARPHGHARLLQQARGHPRRDDRRTGSCGPATREAWTPKATSTSSSASRS